MNKYIKKAFSIIAIIILLFGLAAVYKDFTNELKARAASKFNYTFKTDGSYKWELDGNSLINYVDVYDKTTNQKFTTLKIFYKQDSTGTLSSYSNPGAIPAKTKIGDYTMYSLDSTDNATFPVPNDYKGKYRIFAKSNTTTIYKDVFYTINPSEAALTGFEGYIFEVGDNDTYLKVSSPDPNNWYGAYLTDTKASITAGGSPVTPPTTGGTGTDTAGGCGKLEDACKPSPPATSNLVADSDIPTVSETLKQSNIATAWALALDLVNVIAIFALLAIAFANILHLDPETWNFKRMIPALVIGLIAANFSHLICRAIIDFAGMLMNFFVPKEKAVDVAANIYVGMYGGWTGATVGGITVIGGGIVTLVGIFLFPEVACGALLIGLLILGFPVLITIVLWFILAARTYLLWLLVILSPIAFFGMFLDPFKKIVGMWWTYFWQWTFMGPVAYFFIYLAEGFAKDTSANNPITGCFDPSNADQVGGFTKYIVVNAFLIMAIIIPFLLGGKIMGYWGQFGKWLGATGAKVGFGAGGGAIEKIGRKIGSEKIQRLGKATQQVPYLPEAVFGREGVLANMGKARTKETQSGIERTLKTRFPGLMKEQNRVFALENGGDWARESSAEDLKEGALSGLKKGRDDLLGANIRALGVKALSDREQSERLKAAELLKKDFGLSVSEARSFVFDDFEDSKNAISIIKSQYKVHKEKVKGRKPKTVADRQWHRITNALSKEEQDRGKSEEISDPEAQVPEQAIGVYNVDNPNRFKIPEKESEEPE